ncbi:FAD-dependent oxidoreductase domain-containing protein 2 isoform X4 [Marmota marmota marmota]|uniref:FAD-dependent oxidoreductase domain-containing protein 2 isoform X4 n=1 Tax=Marmota marmota marmota TaxID=9994 RepID=UPI0020921790|nr:FAD-dependent oxidoreductase domain-containing protein 2 isoform X4 [Marmota marmota marmota]
MHLSAAARLWGPPGLLLTLVLHPTLCVSSHRDYCVLGAGPAGLQMASFLQRAGRDYVVFERASAPGSFFTRYPRHRKLISINKRYTGKANAEFNLRHDWNSLLSHDPRLLFRHYSRAYFPDAGDMVRYLGDFADTLGLHVLYNTTITHVTLDKDQRAWNGHYFILIDQKGHTYQCSVLLVATGVSVPNQVDFPGSEYAEGYESVSVDPGDFVGQNVLILGRGNSAFETAENILGVTNFIHMLSRSRVRLSWATHYVGDLRAINNGLLDTYQLKSLDGLLESDLTDLAIVKDHEGRFHITLKFFLEETSTNQSADAIPLPQDDNDNFAMRVAYDRVIRCLGWRFDFSIFNQSLRLSSGSEFSKKYPLIRASYESKGSRGLFILGTASHSVDYRKSAGGFIHGFRYTGLHLPQSEHRYDLQCHRLFLPLALSVRAVHRLLEHRHHGVAWPSTELPITQLTNAIIRRVNEASGLYQMFSVLADVILLKEAGGEVPPCTVAPAAAHGHPPRRGRLPDRLDRARGTHPAPAALPGELSGHRPAELLRRVLFPVHPDAPEAAPVLPAGVPENAGAHGHREPAAAWRGEWAPAGLCHHGRAPGGQQPAAWGTRARRSPPVSGASTPVP